MRRVFMLAAMGLVGLLNSGCLLNCYSSDPSLRIRELLNQSENLRNIEGEWERFWMVDQPSHLTPDRVHGGVG
jgi:hypothetical protein